MSMPESPPKSLRSTTGLRYPAIPGRYHGKAKEVGFEVASTLVGRSRSWAGRCCGLQVLRTRRDRYCPPVPVDSRCGADRARTGRDPHRRHQAASRLVLASGKEDSASQGHRRGRRPCSAGSDEWWPGFGARVVRLSSMISMTSTRPAGIGLCMSPGRMGICPSDGRGAHPSSGAAWLHACELGCGSPATCWRRQAVTPIAEDVCDRTLRDQLRGRV
jgi:hypothetical protein